MRGSGLLSWPFPLARPDATPRAAITALCVAGSDLGNIGGFPSGGCAPVMAGLDPAIHTAPLKESGHRLDLATSKGPIRATSFCSFIAPKQWMAESSPAMTPSFAALPAPNTNAIRVGIFLAEIEKICY